MASPPASCDVGVKAGPRSARLCDPHRVSREPRNPPTGSADARPPGARPDRRPAPPLAPRAHLALGALLVGLGLAGWAALLAAVELSGGVASADAPLLDGLAGARTPWLTAVLSAVSAVTGPAAVLLVAVVGSAVRGLRTRAWWRPALLAGAVLLATVLAAVTKVVVGRPRPPLDGMVVPGSVTSASFPSGHTTGTATLLLVLGYLLWVRDPRGRTLVLVLPGAVAGVGLVAGSRLYLGYHYLTDVLAGGALAVAVVGVVVLVDRGRAGGRPPGQAPAGAAPGRPGSSAPGRRAASEMRSSSAATTQLTSSDDPP